MGKFVRKFIPIILLTLIPTFLIWLPFFLRIEKVWGIPLKRDGMATIVANYDGPLYIAVAKTFYNKEQIKQNFSFGLPTEYYPAHFPMFPALVRLTSSVTNYPYAMLIVTLTSSVLAMIFFRKFISEFVDSKHVLWMCFIFSILPARWLIVRSVGSAEPLFLAAIIASVYYFNRKNYLLAGLWGVVAQLTKSPGILLFVAYMTALAIPKFKELALSSLRKWVYTIDFLRILPIFLIPLSLVGLFLFYKVRVDDFLAYFHSGDNIHLFFPPFQIFNYSQSWVGTFWLEEIIFIYLLGGLGLAKSAKMNNPAIFSLLLVFFVSILFVSHRDLIRYSLPIVPFLLAAYSDTLIKKEFKYVMALLLIPIYLFSLAYITQNVMPISDWSPLL